MIVLNVVILFILFTSLYLVITGPQDTPYENGHFKLNIEIPQNYPYDPPIMRFDTRVYHPNIDEEGRICLDSLKHGSGVLVIFVLLIIG